MHNGYVKLWRKTVDSQIFQNESLLKVWVWCLMKANHKDKWTNLKTGKGFTEIKVLKGQFIFGRRSAAKELKMKPSSIRNRMEKLKNIGNLDMQPDTHYSLITIANWDIYQSENNKNDRQKDRQRTPKGQPEDTNKNDKNVKKKNIPHQDAENFYLTKKKKKLTGLRLKTFEEFWKCFNYKKDKASAADSWLEIPSLNNNMVGLIYEAAKLEAKKRPELIENGQTPKMAQDWISSRRWEDEEAKEPETKIIYHPEFEVE